MNDKRMTLPSPTSYAFKRIMPVGIACAYFLATLPARANQDATALANPWTIVLNRYAKTAVQVSPVDGYEDGYVFRHCDIRFQGEKRDEVTLSRCQIIDSQILSRAQALRILTKAAEGPKSRLKSDGPGRQLSLLRYAESISGLVSFFVLGSLTLVPMGLATVKPGANIWALLASGLLLVGSCAIAHFKANDVERKIESLQTSLRLMTSEAGDVLLVQEIFPADHVADLNGITVDDLKEEAGIFSDALANIIQENLLALPDRA
jgi:hypothetical protein